MSGDDWKPGEFELQILMGCLSKNFIAPKSMSIEQLERSLAEHVKFWHWSDAAGVGNYLIKTRRNRFFPTVGEVLDAYSTVCDLGDFLQRWADSYIVKYGPNSLDCTAVNFAKEIAREAFSLGQGYGLRGVSSDNLERMGRYLLANAKEARP